MDNDNYNIDELIKENSEEINIKAEDQKNKNKLMKILDSDLDENSLSDLKEENSSDFDRVKQQLKITDDTANEYIRTSKTDRRLKIGYGITLLILLCVQIIVVNIILFLVGFGILNINDITFNIFISGTLIEVVAVIQIIVKYLFHDNLGNIFKDLFNNNKK